MTTQFKASRSSIKSCNWPINELPGISPQDCAQLLECGITTTGQLMVKAGTKANKALVTPVKKAFNFDQKGELTPKNDK